jgi:transcriptional regulator with XRE-family HTH domain
LGTRGKVRERGNGGDSVEPTIGGRIRQLRRERKPRLTQRELAERAGVSVDLIAKLEQGAKQTALLTTLHKIAWALDVDVTVLLSSPARVDVPSGEGAGVVAIRRAITGGNEESEPVSLEELGQSTAYAWSAYWTSRFDTLGGLLPELLTSARATAGETASAGAFAVLSEVYGVTASTLVHLGYVDLAYTAMERAMTAADHSGDELRRASLVGWMSWLLLHQTGSADQAQRLAVGMAERIEPKLGHARPEHVAVWGSLLVSGAVAAARQEQADTADDLLSLAEAAATRLDATGSAVRRDYETPFGLPQVIMQQVDVSLVTGRPGPALDIARRMPPDAPLPLAAKARHLADKAAAQAALGRDREATDTLLTIERDAPNWIVYQSYPRTICRELVERERRVRTPRLRGLAERLGVG